MTLILHKNRFYDGLVSEETELTGLHLRDALDERVLAAKPLVDQASPDFIQENHAILKNNNQLFAWRIRRVRTPRSTQHARFVLVPTDNRTTTIWLKGRVHELTPLLGDEATVYLKESKSIKYATDPAVVRLFTQLVAARKRMTIALRKESLQRDLRLYGIRCDLPDTAIHAALTMLRRMYRWEMVI